jgi:23S rRNA pseudouridine1911/1915/1917 synthase
MNLEEHDHEEFYERLRIVVDEGQNPLRIDKYLLNRIMNVTRNKIQEAAKNDCLLVNDVPVKSNYKVKPLDQIVVRMPDPIRNTDILPENIPIDVVYEDDYVILVNKIAGMVVHPAYANFTGTLVNALRYHFGDLPAGLNPEFRAGLVHRIDKDTSGLLVVAKTDDALNKLARQFFHHSIHRKYVALVWGNVENDEGTIDKNLKRHPKDRRLITTTEDEDGKRAITHYKVVERFGYATLLEFRLETGRTHQIRVHTKSIGHPIFADTTYGGDGVVYGPSFSKYQQFITNCYKIISRQALHACELGFVHPNTEEYVEFKVDLPEDIHEVVEKWRNFAHYNNV